MSLDVSKCTLERHLSKCIFHCISITCISCCHQEPHPCLLRLFLLDFFSLFETWFCLGCLRWGLSLLLHLTNPEVRRWSNCPPCFSSLRWNRPFYSAHKNLLLWNSCHLIVLFFLMHHPLMAASSSLIMGEFGTWLALLFLLWTPSSFLVSLASVLMTHPTSWPLSSWSHLYWPFNFPNKWWSTDDLPGTILAPRVIDVIG